MKANVSPRKPGLDTRPKWVKFKEDDHGEEEAQKQELLEKVEVLGDLGAMTDIGAPVCVNTVLTQIRPHSFNSNPASEGESIASDLGTIFETYISAVPGFEEHRAQLEADIKARAQTPEQRKSEYEEIQAAWRAHNEEQYWKYKDALDESGTCTSDGLPSMKGRGRGRGRGRGAQSFQRPPLVA